MSDHQYNDEYLAAFVSGRSGLERFYVLQTPEVIGPGLVGWINNSDEKNYLMISDNLLLSKLVDYLIRSGAPVFTESWQEEEHRL